MYKFSDVIGQDQIKTYFKNAIETGNHAHAYIINGENGSGKEFISRIISATLQCEKKGTNPCGECHSCIQAETNNQPDIIYVSHKKPNSIGVDDVREQLNSDIGIKPYSSEYKIYVINEGEKLTTQAQNALLKTLEEPPAYGIIFILTTNIQTILPTIVSRCVVLNMKPVQDDLVNKYLMEDLMIPDYKAKLCVSFARGNIGRAKQLATNDEFDKIREEAIFLMRHVKELEINEMSAAIKKINEYNMSASDYLDIIAVWFRDVLLFKATKDANALIFKGEIKYIKVAAQTSDYEGLETILDAIEKTKARVRANVNFDLAMELLLLTIKEN
jgi:DNA polymerase-3 subunit delta'